MFHQGLAGVVGHQCLTGVVDDEYRGRLEWRVDPDSLLAGFGLSV
jgi:hypothetical protein